MVKSSFKFNPPRSCHFQINNRNITNISITLITNQDVVPFRATILFTYPLNFSNLFVLFLQKYPIMPENEKANCEYFRIDHNIHPDGQVRSDPACGYSGEYDQKTICKGNREKCAYPDKW